MMSADLDNQPYDNVEFPIRRPGPGGGGWVTPGVGPGPQGRNLITGGQREKGYSLSPVVEGALAEEEEESGRGDEQRQMGAQKQPSVISTMTIPSNVIQTPPRAVNQNHVSQTTIPNQVDTQKQTVESAPPHLKPANQIKRPPPSPSRDSNTSFKYDQSKDFTWSAFGPTSQAVFENAYTRHKYFYKLSDTVFKQGGKMKTTVWDVTGKPGETLTYEQLLQGVLVDGERLLLGGGWLYFHDVEFYEPDCTKPLKPPLGEGRICLTNLRMLLLCAETSSDAKLSEFGDHSSDGSGSYKLAVSKLNNIYFQNIPLDCFESVELTSTVGTSVEAKLEQKAPCCCGLFACIGFGSCGFRWKSTPPLPVNVNKRQIRLGVYMPPWRTPSVMVINIHPKMSLTAARDFATELQNYVPQMQYTAKNRGATIL